MKWTNRTAWAIPAVLGALAACTPDVDTPREGVAARENASETGALVPLCGEDAAIAPQLTLEIRASEGTTSLEVHNTTDGALSAHVVLTVFDGIDEVERTLEPIEVGPRSSVTLPIPADAVPATGARLRARVDAFRSSDPTQRVSRSFSNRVELRRGVVIEASADEVPIFDPAGTLTEEDRAVLRQRMPKEPGVASEGVFIDPSVTRADLMAIRHEGLEEVQR